MARRGTVTVGELNRLSGVFEGLGWPIDNGGGLFNRFVVMLGGLNVEQRDLVLTITQDFLHLPFAQFEPMIETLAGKIMAHVGLGQHVIALPAVREESHGQIKSGAFVQYLLRVRLEPKISRLNGTFDCWDRADLVAKMAPARQDALIIFVDDFIGSGETVLAAVEYFRRKGVNPSDRILAAAVVAQQAAIIELQLDEVPSVVVCVRERGVSDSTRLPDIPSARKVMETIEEVLTVQPGCHLGYRQAEALVSLLRCPDNTFPVYWTPTNRSGDEWSAPFPRS